MPGPERTLIRESATTRAIGPPLGAGVARTSDATVVEDTVAEDTVVEDTVDVGASTAAIVVVAAVVSVVALVPVMGICAAMSAAPCALTTGKLSMPNATTWFAATQPTALSFVLT